MTPEPSSTRDARIRLEGLLEQAERLLADVGLLLFTVRETRYRWSPEALDALVRLSEATPHIPPLVAQLRRHDAAGGVATDLEMTLHLLDRLTPAHGALIERLRRLADGTILDQGTTATRGWAPPLVALAVSVAVLGVLDGFGPLVLATESVIACALALSVLNPPPPARWRIEGRELVWETASAPAERLQLGDLRAVRLPASRDHVRLSWPAPGASSPHASHEVTLSTAASVRLAGALELLRHPAWAPGARDEGALVGRAADGTTSGWALACASGVLFLAHGSATEATRALLRTLAPENFLDEEGFLFELARLPDAAIAAVSTAIGAGPTRWRWVPSAAVRRVSSHGHTAVACDVTTISWAATSPVSDAKLERWFAAGP